MIAVDTNLLVYAHREDADWFGPASECLRSLAEGVELWSMPRPCLHDGNLGYRDLDEPGVDLP